MMIPAPLLGHGIIPRSWYQHIRYTNKRGQFTCHLSCCLLADLIARYTLEGTLRYEESSSTSYRECASGKAIQRSPDEIADILGCSPKIARESLSLLESLGLITTKVGSVQTPYGVIPRALFIDLNVEAISRISEQKGAIAS